MKKFVSMMLSLVAASAFAGVVEPFKQFTQADYNDAPKPGQSVWKYSDTFTLNVKANTTVWLSNYVNSWYDPKPLNPLHGNVFDMGAQKYGYIYKSDLPTVDGVTDLTLPNGSYDNLIHWSNGETNTITYTHDPNPDITNYTTGYLLDTFKEDAEIYLVMTTLASDGGETVDTYQYVQDANNATTMLSRQHNTVDLAGNVRVNFGIGVRDEHEIGREFVAVFSGVTSDTVPSGQPLPGLLFAGMLSLGTVFGASKMRKRS
ncbi:MAG: hypothetical protein IJJ26_09670 [Victivallales bacterium]|nr:hypothetical protein [Victivallales bacterium]